MSVQEGGRGAEGQGQEVSSLTREERAFNLGAACACVCVCVCVKEINIGGIS